VGTQVSQLPFFKGQFAKLLHLLATNATE
jgi:hypothetical protein